MSKLVNLVLDRNPNNNLLPPGWYEWAENLANTQWDKLPRKTKEIVSRILINSGQYE